MELSLGRTLNSTWAIVSAVLLLCVAGVPGRPQDRSAAQDLPVVWRVADRFRLFSEAAEDAKARVEALMDRIAASADRPLAEHFDAFVYTLAFANGASLRISNYQPGGPGPRAAGRAARAGD